MTKLRVTDHAVLGFLQHAAGVDVEGLRSDIASGLERAHRAAASIGAADYIVKAGGMVFVVRNNDGAIHSCTSAMAEHGPIARHKLLANGQK